MTTRPTLPELVTAIRGALADGPHERAPEELDRDTEAVIAALAALGLRRNDGDGVGV